MKNENKVDEMSDILDCLNQYVPILPYKENIPCSNGQIVVQEKAKFHSLLIGGYQYRARSAKGQRKQQHPSQEIILLGTSCGGLACKT